MLDYIFQAWPILLALVIYFVRLETKLAVIIRDIEWIKTYVITNSDPDHAPAGGNPAHDLPFKRRTRPPR